MSKKPVRNESEPPVLTPIVLGNCVITRCSMETHQLAWPCDESPAGAISSRVGTHTRDLVRIKPPLNLLCHPVWRYA